MELGYYQWSSNWLLPQQPSGRVSGQPPGCARMPPGYGCWGGAKEDRIRATPIEGTEQEIFWRGVYVGRSVW